MDTNKQTAVEWLKKELLKNGYVNKGYHNQDSLNHLENLFEQAKAMEKEQIINALGVGCQIKPTGLIGYYEMGEEYFNETYGRHY